MKVETAQGYNKEKAYNTTSLTNDVSMFKNATQAWKKMGEPHNTDDFLRRYCREKKCIGAYLTIIPCVDDKRLRPYNIINEVTNTRRKTKTTYLVKEAQFDAKFYPHEKEEVNEEGETVTRTVSLPYKLVEKEYEKLNEETGEMESFTKTIKETNVSIKKIGAVVFEADSKREAEKKLKELIEMNKRDYVVEIAKIVVEGQKYASYGKYTPSKTAKKGTFIFGSIES